MSRLPEQLEFEVGGDVAAAMPKAKEGTAPAVKSMVTEFVDKLSGEDAGSKKIVADAAAAANSSPVEKTFQRETATHSEGDQNRSESVDPEIPVAPVAVASEKQSLGGDKQTLTDSEGDQNKVPETPAQPVGAKESEATQDDAERNPLPNAEMVQVNKTNASKTKEEIQSHFGKTIAEAAAAMNMSVKKLRKLNKEHGISKWPQPKRNNIKPVQGNEPAEAKVIIKAYFGAELKTMFHLDGGFKEPEEKLRKTFAYTGSVRIFCKDKDHESWLLTCDEDLDFHIPRNVDKDQTMVIEVVDKN